MKMTNLMWFKERGLSLKGAENFVQNIFPKTFLLVDLVKCLPDYLVF